MAAAAAAAAAADESGRLSNPRQAPYNNGGEDDDETWVWVDETKEKEAAAAAVGTKMGEVMTLTFPAADPTSSEEGKGSSARSSYGLVSLTELYGDGGYESGTEEERAEFMEDLRSFYRDTKKKIRFDHQGGSPEQLNLLKLWRAVTKLGGYQQVTSSQMWRQVGQSLRVPRTVSGTLRNVYEKALLAYEKHKLPNTTATDELSFPNRGSASSPVPVPENQGREMGSHWQSESFMDT